jgi:hypothetical protein
MCYRRASKFDHFPGHQRPGLRVFKEASRQMNPATHETPHRSKQYFRGPLTSYGGSKKPDIQVKLSRTSEHPRQCRLDIYRRAFKFDHRTGHPRIRSLTEASRNPKPAPLTMSWHAKDNCTGHLSRRRRTATNKKNARDPRPPNASHAGQPNH